MEHKKDYRLVNWVEGMNVEFTHLQQLENFFINRLCDNQSMRLTPYNYGLLPSSDRYGNSAEFDISEKVTGQIEIRLRKCNAITAEGCRIAYNPKEDDYIIYNHSFENNEQSRSKDIVYWDVILTVDPFKRVPTGIPNEEETPPRHPDVSEYYKLSIIPQGKVNYNQLGLYHLLIGRIRQKEGHYEIDGNYIPPCTSMNSHPELLDYYERFGGYLNEIEKTSKIIISKVRNRSQNSPIANHICSTCENMMRYIASIYFSYRNIGSAAAPIEIVNCFSTLSHMCYVSLSFISKTEKEELLKYFYEWSDVTPGSFEELLVNALSIKYDHSNLRTIMLQLESFLNVMTELWSKLSRLEYIGQHKENVVVSERVHQAEIIKGKGGWTILD